MGKDDIKNEYDAAWEVIKDAHAGNGNYRWSGQCHALHLRAVLHFTSQQGAFKTALQDMENADRRFVPLSRYLDTSPHRNDQNLTDFGDHDVQFFVDKFKAVFDATAVSPPLCEPHGASHRRERPTADRRRY